ncbi:MAG: hypothetical protein CMJ58_25655 [Planctomycetaceae bacterium]|nr:hypothetical protein [Planctomycetaceae bacterium]
MALAFPELRYCWNYHDDLDDPAEFIQLALSRDCKVRAAACYPAVAKKANELLRQHGDSRSVPEITWSDAAEPHTADDHPNDKLLLVYGEMLVAEITSGKYDSFASFLDDSEDWPVLLGGHPDLRNVIGIARDLVRSERCRNTPIARRIDAASTGAVVPTPGGGQAIIVSGAFDGVWHWNVWQTLIGEHFSNKNNGMADVYIGCMPDVARYIVQMPCEPEHRKFDVLELSNMFEQADCGRLFNDEVAAMRHFIIAHEFGHIECGHVDALRDMQEVGEEPTRDDLLSWELEADDFAFRELSRHLPPHRAKHAAFWVLALQHFAFHQSSPSHLFVQGDAMIRLSYLDHVNKDSWPGLNAEALSSMAGLVNRCRCELPVNRPLLRLLPSIDAYHDELLVSAAYSLFPELASVPRRQWTSATQQPISYLSATHAERLGLWDTAQQFFDSTLFRRITGGNRRMS